MELKLLDAQGQAASKVEAPDTVFGRDFNEPLIHQVVIAYRANGRSANRAQKDRGEVKHSTKKPFRQKGTGRAISCSEDPDVKGTETGIRKYSWVLF